MKTPLHVSIISARRPENVPLMHAYFRAPEDVWWYVADGEADAYRAAGAANVVEGGGLMESRNFALEHAFAEDLHCVQLSDDLEWLRYAPTTSRAHWYEIPIEQAFKKLYRGLRSVGAYLAGAAATNNPYFAKRELNPKGFCLGDMIMVRPGCDLWFDENLRLKEDYDYTLQHLARFGRVARMERVLPSWSHRKNEGGAVAYRTSDIEQQTIQYLLSKWPGALREQHRRQDEVQMQWPPRKDSPMYRKVYEKQRAKGISVDTLDPPDEV
jgi:hypothetical protein